MCVQQALLGVYALGWGQCARSTATWVATHMLFFDFGCTSRSTFFFVDLLSGVWMLKGIIWGNIGGIWCYSWSLHGVVGLIFGRTSFTFTGTFSIKIGP